MDEAERPWLQNSRQAKGKDRQRPWRCRQDEGRFHTGWRNAVWLGLGVARRQRRKADCQQDTEWRKSARSRRNTNSRLRRMGALVLHRLPQSAARLSQGVPRSLGELGTRGRNVRRGNQVGQAQRIEPRRILLKNPTTDRRVYSPIERHLSCSSPLRSSQRLRSATTASDGMTIPIRNTAICCSPSTARASRTSAHSHSSTCTNMVAVSTWPRRSQRKCCRSGCSKRGALSEPPSE